LRLPFRFRQRINHPEYCESAGEAEMAEDGVENAKLAGATPLLEFIGDGASVFSY
jgi:hypothetical protein